MADTTNKELISFDDFKHVDLRAGTIDRAEDFPEARTPAYTPAYKIWADFGPEIGTLKSSAQVTDLYTKEELEGRQILGVVNFPDKQIGPLMSEFLVCGFRRPEDGAVVLASVEREVPNGTRLS